MKYLTLALLSFTAITLSTLTGCGDEGCMPYVGPGVRLTVQDLMGSPVLCGSTVHVHTIEGELIEYREFFNASCSDSTSPQVNLLEERPGNFQLTISKDGYNDAVIDVVVELNSAGCNVIPVDVTVQLEPI